MDAARPPSSAAAAVRPQDAKMSYICGGKPSPNPATIARLIT